MREDSSHRSDAEIALSITLTLALRPAAARCSSACSPTAMDDARRS